MIKFFRKIRQSLLSDNKFSKYLLYALGEIILVVAGILIALQLNIYTENRTNETIEAGYLKGILSELDQDLYELNDLILEDSLHLNAYTTILKAFQNTNIRHSPFLIKAIGVANTYNSFKGNNIVFEDLKSSGKTNYIADDELRRSVLKYYKASQDIITSQNESSNRQMRELVAKAFLTNLDLNSLIERYMVPRQWNSELDELDLSFFDKEIHSVEVQHFSNSVSMMKAVTLLNTSQNESLLFKASTTKSKIISFLTAKGIEIQNTVPPNTLEAIKSGNIAQLDQLVTDESLNNCFFMTGESGNYLVHCITYKSLKSLQYFVERGADLESVCEKKTPLMYAIKYGEFEMVKYLVDQGADLAASNHGKSPLDYAKAYDHPEIEQYLVEKGAK